MVNKIVLKKATIWFMTLMCCHQNCTFFDKLYSSISPRLCPSMKQRWVSEDQRLVRFHTQVWL